MLKYLLLAALSISTLAAGPAQGRMTGTAHDLGRELCRFCHTPHSLEQAGAPLWNRFAPVMARFETYASSTMDRTAGGKPQSVSLVCLSCHDGATSYDAAYGYANRRVPAGDMHAAAPAMRPGGLPDGHPISTTYSGRRSLVLNPARNGTVGRLPLYRTPGAEFDRIECASCHNPHDMTFGSFLRMDNANSALCLTCHIK